MRKLKKRTKRSSNPPANHTLGKGWRFKLGIPGTEQFQKSCRYIFEGRKKDLIRELGVTYTSIWEFQQKPEAMALIEEFAKEEKDAFKKIINGNSQNLAKRYLQLAMQTEDIGVARRACRDLAEAMGHIVTYSTPPADTAGEDKLKKELTDADRETIKRIFQNMAQGNKQG